MSKLRLKIKKGIFYILLIAILLSTTVSSYPLIFKDGSTRLPESDTPKSSATPSTHCKTPVQWDDFNFNKGSGGSIGDLQKNDNNYARIDAEPVTYPLDPPIQIFFLDCEITWSFTDPNLQSINYLKFDYRTTKSVNLNLDIYNWDTGEWLTLESHSTTGWITGSYNLSDPYISATLQVRVQFFCIGEDFDMELDQLSIQCSNPEDWDEPKILIGSNNQYFPNIEESKLGFTIDTVDDLDPIIEFQIKEQISDPAPRYIRIYIDNTKIFEKNIDIDDYYTDTISAPQLGSLGAHNIVIEINPSPYGDDPYYMLEFLKVRGVNFIEFIEDNGDYYTPIYIKSEDETMDYGTVALNTLLTNLYNPNGEINDNKPWFLTSLITAIDDDVEGGNSLPVMVRDYYIHRFKVQFRILDPNGNYLKLGKYSIKEQATSAEADPDPSNINEQVQRLGMLLVHLFADMIPGYIDWNYIVDYIYYLTGSDTLTESTLIPSVGYDCFSVEWTVGIHNYGNANPLLFDFDAGIAPRQRLKELSLWAIWDLNLQENYGNYQIEITWEVDIREYIAYFVIENYIIIILMYTKHIINPAFILTGTRYINFGFIE